jgi:hypothetical protein
VDFEPAAFFATFFVAAALLEADLLFEDFLGGLRFSAEVALPRAGLFEPTDFFLLFFLGAIRAV